MSNGRTNASSPAWADVEINVRGETQRVLSTDFEREPSPDEVTDMLCRKLVKALSKRGSR